MRKLTLEISEENILNHLELPSGLFAKALINVEEVIIDLKDEGAFYAEIVDLLQHIRVSEPSTLQKLELRVKSPTKRKLSLCSDLVSDVVLKLERLTLLGCLDIE